MRDPPDELVFDCKWSKKTPSAKVLAKIRKAVVEHRVELLREWEQRVSRAGIDPHAQAQAEAAKGST